MTTCDGEEVTDRIFLPIDLVMLLVVTWITLTVAQQDINWQKPFFELIDDAKFWVYALYIIAIALTIGRYFAVGCTDIDTSLIAIVYNWAASLIVSISSIVPWRFVKNKMKVVAFEKDNLKTCLGVLFVHCIPLLVSAGLIAWQVVETQTILIAWRGIFMVNVASEMVILSSLLVHVRRTMQSLGRKLPRQLIYSMTGTLWMRIGIVGSIVLKLTGVLDKRFLKVVHTAFIITGFAFYYHKQLSAKAFNRAKSSSIPFPEENSQKQSKSKMAVV